ncbi:MULTISPECIES: bifunctional protein-serine/threonine kinase/phosphatase [Brevundimonas]|mgnify:CR=1 FL=1|uniref:Bifunctional protein-serine/threonine kinase/phosphatase n=1 Tax=Brevundimonas mediterranea TaxID=74329 RepID=A0AB37E8H4_9CAUL|nr:MULTISPECIES: bifunctional protein-serine/threonine kinase/phosphatase [Brevundimonas]EDX81134.1 protein kinase domain [Brevundimonas sp. BAL3]MBA4330888.1 bifunctional protein-serine/threonine kinase/phosphatase [Brevundimonas sp.]QIH73472.1 bifunctional protein-serine/threonine kinase/phosphatase [Brevundimonas mediterranea]TAJ40010.1 MAG: bifunctional protein-serine/threonine kinase/phosphatase [Brevundimonas sp.]
MTDARLEIAAGFATAQGPKADNQDFGGVHLGTPAEQREHGVVAVIADGVSGSKAGRMAAELTTRSFIDGYLDQNPLNGIAANGIKALRGFNRWLHARGKIDPAMEAAATTFTALILRGREAVALHVGDSRAYHFRDGVLTRLTEDHTRAQQGLSHVLYRAVGIEADVKLDVRHVGLAPHDRLLLTTDGVHGVLTDEALARLLARRGSPDADAQAILAEVAEAGARDNATVLVIDVMGIGAPDWEAITAEAEGLAILPPPKQGETVDGFHLERLVADGRYTRLFLARSGDARSGDERVVLKFPKPAAVSERGARTAFLREAFIGRRIDSPFVGKVLSLDAGRQSRLYIVQPFYPGQTLHARLAEDGPFEIAEGIGVALKLARGVAALHRAGVTHRDIKPDNVILETNGGLKLVDLGVARLKRAEEFAEAEAPGTPGYKAPEMYDGESGSAATDQFALGVTLYRLFTGAYPWGEVDPSDAPRFDRAPVSLGRRRPDMPAWLEAAVMRAVSVDPDERFEDVEELIHVLETGSAAAAPAPRPLSLIERDPVRFWQGLCLVLVVLLMVSLATR